MHVFSQLPVCLLWYWMRGTSWWASSISCVATWVQKVGLSGNALLTGTETARLMDFIIKLSKFLSVLFMSPCAGVHSWSFEAVLLEKLVSTSSDTEGLRTRHSAAGWEKSWWVSGSALCSVCPLYCTFFDTQIKACSLLNNKNTSSVRPTPTTFTVHMLFTSITVTAYISANTSTNIVFQLILLKWH